MCFSRLFCVFEVLLRRYFLFQFYRITFILRHEKFVDKLKAANFSSKKNQSKINLFSPENKKYARDRKIDSASDERIGH